MQIGQGIQPRSCQQPIWADGPATSVQTDSAAASWLAASYCIWPDRAPSPVELEACSMATGYCHVQTSMWVALSEHPAMTCRALNLQDRSEAASQQKMSDEEKQKYRAAGPSMSIAQRNDELERQNFANEPTLRLVATC